METIILAVFVGLGIAFFATQNTQGVTIHFMSYQWRHIPFYLVIVGSLLTGLLLAWIFSLVQSLSSFLNLQTKDSQLKDAHKDIALLTKRVHQLELENAQLNSTEEGDAYDEKSL